MTTQSNKKPKNPIFTPEKTTASLDFMKWVSSASVAPPQRPNRIRELAEDAVTSDKAVLILNWICPPGTPLAFDSQSEKLYRRFVGIDPEEGFNRDYRLGPRIPQEKRQLEMLEKAKIPYLYIKLVADDNPYCLYPASLRMDGEQTTQSAINNFADYSQQRLDAELGKDRVYVTTMSDALGPQAFGELISTFESLNTDDLLPYLPSSTLTTELDILAKHTKIDESLTSRLKGLSYDVIKQYAVEGYFLNQVFGDNVVLSWNESTRRSNIIDSLRKLKGIPPLPKLFVLYERKNGKIINNF